MSKRAFQQILSTNMSVLDYCLECAEINLVSGIFLNKILLLLSLFVVLEVLA